MAETYASRDARRRAAMAEALMGSAMTAPQGGMVGRYYVGEGIGSGLTRIGQALLANRMGRKADDAESEYQAGQRAKREAAMTGLITDITEPREETVQDFGNVSVMKNRKPSNQEIGAALLKYQNETGMEVPKDLVGLLAPESGLGGGANKFQFGPAVITEVDGKPAFAVPTYDTASRGVKVETAPIGGPVLNRNTGLSAQGQSALDVRTEGEKTRVKTEAELAFAEQQAAAAAAKAEAEAEAKAKAGREQAARDAERAKSDINAILDEAEGLIGKGTGSAVGALLSDLRVKTNSANEKDAVNAQLKVLSGNLLGEFAKSQILGINPTDSDRKMYEEMAGKIGDPTLDPAVRLAALDQVRKMAAARAASARGSSQPQSKPAATKTMKWNPATKRVE